MAGLVMTRRPDALAQSRDLAFRAAVDVVRGQGRGAWVTDEVECADGTRTTQDVILTEHGSAVLLSIVPAEEIPERQRIRARQYVNRVRRKLNLGPIAMRYLGPPRWGEGAEIIVKTLVGSHPAFDETAPAGCQRVWAGAVVSSHPWTIFLPVFFLPDDELERLVAHEVRHVDQLWGHATHVPDDFRERELDAYAFADAWMEAHR